jgi:hypothetical protein
VWWSLSRLGGDSADLDLDGEANGIPGLGVQVSTPWEAGVGQTDWKQKVLDRLTGVQGHTVRFEDLRWVEAPERKLEGGLKLAHYYTLVTLYTNASVRSFDKKEVGGGGLFTDPTYYSHETTARIKHTRDVRFWASYSRREYGADGRLLELLRGQVQKSKSVPGLGLVQTDDGDGGSIVYRVGFVARARPWETPAPGQAPLAAGFVGLDVVAARAGIGGVETQGTAGLGDLQKAWCQVVRCGDTAHTLDLDVPPQGYDVAQPVASLSTLSGGVALSEGKPLVAQREVPPVGTTPLPRLPHLTRFALAANLRAGALLRKGSFGHTRNLVPINTYAQYVLKFSVAMAPDTLMVTSDEAVMPKPGELDVVTAAPRPTGLFAWIRRHLLGVGLVVGLVAVCVLLVLVPGLRQALSAALKRLKGTG